MCIRDSFSRIPTDHVHLLIRSVHARNCRLDDPDCSVHLNTLMAQAVLRAAYSLDVYKRQKHTTTCSCVGKQVDGICE